MPRFMQMMRQIGLESWLLGLKYLKLEYADFFFFKKKVGHLDFSRAAADTPYAMWLPQPLLLNALYEKAKPFPSFEMWFEAAAKHTVKDGDTVKGVVVKKGEEEIEVEARVTVMADGRYSEILKEGLKNGDYEMEYHDHRFDVLWFTIKKPPGWDNGFKILFSFNRSFLLLPKYPDEIQVGILASPGQLAIMRKRGVEAMKAELEAANPAFKDFADRTKDFSDFHPLKAELFLIKDWAKNGSLLIGDAAHCCSPAGAIGVSIAVGTAIIAADVIYRGLRETKGILPKTILDRVQEIREPDVRQVHAIQKRFTLATAVLPVQWALPLTVTLIAKTPFFLKFQRRLMTLQKPMPISPELAF